MVNSKKGLVFVTSVTSGVAALLSLVSLGTQQWIVAEGKFAGTEGSSLYYSEIQYGLFGGVLRQNLGGSITPFELTMTCLVGNNVCAMLCKTTADGRIQELEKLYNKEEVSFDSDCPRVTKTYKEPLPPLQPFYREASGDRDFINAGCYISTVIFLLISSIMGLLAAALSVWNTASNPVQTYFTIVGIYIYNAIATVTILLVICTWGAHFSITLLKNVCIYFTITGEMETDGKANLGFSYWLNIGSLFLYITSIFVLYMRQYMVDREPKNTLDLDTAPDNLILY